MTWGQFKRFSLVGRGYNGNHFCLGESAELPALVASTSPGGYENYMQPIDTAGAGATNSRLVGIDTSTGASAYFNTTDLYGGFTWHHKTGGTQEQIMQVHRGDGTGRLFDIVPTSGNQLSIYGQASSVTPLTRQNMTAAYTYADAEVSLIEWHLDMVGGVVNIYVRNLLTYALKEWFIASGSLIVGDEAGGDVFGDLYVGRVLNRSAGNTKANFGDLRYASTSGFVPPYKVHVQKVAAVVSNAGGWSPLGTAAIVDCLQDPDSKSGANGTRIRREASAGTGSGSVITVSMASVIGHIPSGATILGVQAIVDGRHITGGTAARCKLGYTYNGVLTETGNISMNDYVAGDGGYPHTRCIGMFSKSGSDYVGPDGSAWSLTKLGNATLTVTITNDAEAIEVTSLQVAIAYTTMATLNPSLVKDTRIDVAAVGNNYGADPTVAIRANVAGSTIQRILFDFGDISAIPAGSTINSAILTLNCSAVTTGGQPIEFCRMTRTNWTEGAGTLAGADTLTGASWSNYDNSGPSAWTSPGGDFTATGKSSGFNDPTTTGSKTFDIKDVIQACLDNGGLANFVMKRVTESGTLTGATFDSKQGTTPPTLAITYTAPTPSGPIKGSLSLLGAGK